MRNRTISSRYVEILCFQYFERYNTFSQNSGNGKKKIVSNTIEVSVIIEVECVDITE